MSWHIAETREQARVEARDGLFRHNNEYITATLQRPGARAFKAPDEAVAPTLPPRSRSRGSRSSPELPSDGDRTRAR
jgi:limonene 1,2-monooxygenase